MSPSQPHAASPSDHDTAQTPNDSTVSIVDESLQESAAEHLNANFGDLDPASIGPYQIEGVLGQGAMGKVYLATHTQLKRKVAIKTMRQINESNPLRVGRFQREMEAVGRLDHPNIVRATDAGEDSGIQFIAMEFVEGTDLQNILDQYGALSPAVACDVIRQAAEGLKNIQEHELVHRDLKPSNLIVARNGQVKILDLGIARLRNDDQLGTLTADGGLMGTPDFIAPEQVLETGCVDIRADIYSLGCTLYRMLSGHLPFEGPDYGTHVAKVIGHTQNDPTDLVQLAPDTPPQLLAIVKRMMAKLPDERIQTPQEVIDAVAEWADGSELPEMVAGNINKTTIVALNPNKTPKSVSPNSKPPQTVSWKWPAATGLAILAALALGISSLRSNSRNDQPESLATAISPASQTEPSTQTIPVASALPTMPANTVVENGAAMQRVAAATTELNNTTRGLAGSVHNIDSNTQQIAETLEQIRNSFVSSSRGGQIIANPQTIGEIYANARVFAEQGKYERSRESYMRLLDQKVRFVDVHKNFQRLLIAQDGLERARVIYSNIATANEPTSTFAQALLFDEEQKRKTLASLVLQHPKFGPALFELANCATHAASDVRTLTEKKWEKKFLREFVKLHNEGHVLYFYLDQAEAAAAIEEANQRLAQLNNASHPIKPSVSTQFKRERNGWAVRVQTSEPSKSIHYSTDGTTFRSTGVTGRIDHRTGVVTPKESFTLPPNTKVRSLFIKYTDIRNAEHGPFEIPFRKDSIASTTAKKTLEAIRHTWVRFKEQHGTVRIDFSPLFAIRNDIDEIHYGVDVTEPNRILDWKAPSRVAVLLPITKDAQSVVVRIRLKDGWQSEITQFHR